MASQTPVQGQRVAPNQPGPAAKKAAMSPLPAQQKRQGRWGKWVILIPLLLLVATYLLGRTLEPARMRLAGIPAVGKVLFAKPVWPILWNKQSASTDSKGATPPDQTSSAAPAAVTSRPASASTAPDLSREDATLAARMAAADVRESDLFKKEQDFAAREAAMKKRESDVATQEVQLGQTIKATQALQAQLEGQIRGDKDRVEVVRNMRTAGVQQLFGAMTDEEVLRVFLYMDAAEVGKYLAGMDPYRSARLLQALRQVAPPTSSP